MTKTITHSENLRNAIEWLARHNSLEGVPQKAISREAVEKASLMFDLSPLEEDFLIRKFVVNNKDSE